MILKWGYVHWEGLRSLGGLWEALKRCNITPLVLKGYKTVINIIKQLYKIIKQF